MTNNTTSDVEPKIRHALAVLPNKIFTLTSRLTMLFDAVTKLEETVITGSLGLRACTATRY